MPGQARIEMSSLLSANSLPGFEGLNLPSSVTLGTLTKPRAFSSTACAKSRLIARPRLRTGLTLLAQCSSRTCRMYGRHFRELAHNLLPHLSFHRIDLTNRDQIRCLWYVHTNVLVDIDDLSWRKGNHSALLPLVEHQLNRHTGSHARCGRDCKTGSDCGLNG